MSLEAPDGEPTHHSLWIYTAARHSTQHLLHKPVTLAPRLTSTPDAKSCVPLQGGLAGVSGDGWDVREGVPGWDGRFRDATSQGLMHGSWAWCSHCWADGQGCMCGHRPPQKVPEEGSRQ